jgi:hypothetical protein
LAFMELARERNEIAIMKDEGQNLQKRRP